MEELGVFDLHGTFEGAIVDILLDRLSIRIEPWEAEEIAEKIVELIAERIFS